LAFIPQRIFFIFMYRRKVRGREEGRPGLRLPRGGGGKGEWCREGGRGEGREGSYFLLSRLIYIYKEYMLTMEADVKAEKETEN
jgi:hypothetical protein